jgi:uncharacterized RDD family membrane protein YckC
VGGGRPADDDPEVTRVRQPGPPDSPTPPQQGTPYAQPPYGGPVGAQPPAPNPYAPAGQAPYAMPDHNAYASSPPAGYPSGPPMGYGPPMDFYATFGDRAVATLWDAVYGLPPFALMMLGAVVMVGGGALSSSNELEAGAVVMILGAVIVLAATVWSLWRLIANYMLDQGRTGYTYGKRKVGIRCVLAVDGQAPGAGVTFGKYVIHALINQCFYIDYLWCAWDEKRQTLADKMLNTLVIKQPDPLGQSPMFGKRKAG